MSKTHLLLTSDDTSALNLCFPEIQQSDDKKKKVMSAVACTISKKI